MGFFDFFRRNGIEDLDAKRRAHLQKFGRVTEGTILDSTTSDAGEVVYYSYSVDGADYESSELLTEQQLSDLVKYSPGAKVSVRYNPRQHASSIIV